MITGGLAIGGLFVALYATVAVSYERQVVEVGITYGIRIFTWMTALQVLVGTWYLLSLPPAIKALFMGGRCFGNRSHGLWYHVVTGCFSDRVSAAGYYHGTADCAACVCHDRN